MNKLPFLHESTLAQLIQDIDINLDSYREGNFDFILKDKSLSFVPDEGPGAKMNLLEEVNSFSVDTQKGTTKAFSDIQYSKLLFQSLYNLTPYVARDPRLWVFLTHTYLLNYSRKRYPIPEDDEKAIKEIKRHFFCMDEKRGIERDNAASRLWWMGYLASRVKGLTIDDSLKVFLHKTDVRANVVERPSTSQNIVVFSAIIHKLKESLGSDERLFERKIFREFMKELNLLGGVTLMDALTESQVKKEVDVIAVKVLGI